MSILVVDGSTLARNIAVTLQRDGWPVVSADSRGEAIAHLSTQLFSLIVLALSLPDGSARDLLHFLGAHGLPTMTLALGHSGTVEERIAALDSGADDVLPPSCDPREIVAHVRALHRRGRLVSDTIVIGDLELCPRSRVAYRNGRMIKLSPKEFDLLLYLALNRGATVNRNALLRDVFKVGFEPGTNVVEVHIHRLREKIDHDAPKPLLHTIRGEGYVLGEHRLH